MKTLCWAGVWVSIDFAPRIGRSVIVTHTWGPFSVRYRTARDRHSVFNLTYCCAVREAHRYASMFAATDDARLSEYPRPLAQKAHDHGRHETGDSPQATCWRENHRSFSGAKDPAISAFGHNF